MDKVRIEIEERGDEARITGFEGLNKWEYYSTNHSRKKELILEGVYSHVSALGDAIEAFDGPNRTASLDIDKWYRIEYFNSAMSLIKEGVERLREVLSVKLEKKVIVI